MPSTSPSTAACPPDGSNTHKISYTEDLTDPIDVEYPQLTVEDVRACLEYAARAVDERELPVRLSA